MKKITELNLGFNDAVNYQRRENKQLFNNIFVKNYYLDDLLQPNVFFLVGEKAQEKQLIQYILKIMNIRKMCLN